MKQLGVRAQSALTPFFFIMRRITTFFICCLIFSFKVNADGFDETQKIDIAKKFLGSMDQKQNANPQDSFYVSYEDTSSKYTIISRHVNKTKQSGFVVVSNINEQPVILAYDTVASFQGEQLPNHIREWFEGYSAALDVINNTPQLAETYIRSSQYVAETVEPLLNSTMWNQGEPYNILCPVIDGENSPTGCVATAVAQIMSHHKYPERGNGYCHYVTDTEKLNISFDFDNTWFDWENIYERYGALSVEQEDQYTITSNGWLGFINFYVNDGSPSLLEIVISGFFANGIPYLSGDLALLLLDRNGDFVRQISEPKPVNLSAANNEGKTYSFPVAVPSDIDDGAYKICLAFRNRGETNWDIVPNPIYTSKSHIEINKVGNMLLIGEDDYPCASSWEYSLPVATLMEAAGAAVKMDYRKHESGAYDDNVVKGLNQYLNYDNDMSLLSIEDYSDSLWHRSLQKELLEGRPVYYSGAGNSGGHAFVIDGMQTNVENGLVYYHVNWGWGGSCDGYYLLNMLRPSDAGTGGTSGENYANNASMIIGIMPEDNVDHLRMNSKGLLLCGQDFFPGQNLSFDIETLNLLSSNAGFQGDLFVDFIRTDNDTEDVFSCCVLEDFKISSSRGLTGHHSRIVLPDDITPGQYRLSLRCESIDGEVPEMSVENTPFINILPLEEWKGGPYSSTHQYVSIGGCTIARNSSTQERLSMTIETLTNQHSTPIRGQIALLVCEPSGEVLTSLDESKSINIGGYSQKYTFSIGGAFSKNMPDGQYVLRLGFMPSGSDKWSFLYLTNGTEWVSELSVFEIPFEAANGTVFIDGMSFSMVNFPWTNIGRILNDEKTTEGVSFDMSGRPIQTEHLKQLFIRNRNKHIKLNP